MKPKSFITLLAAVLLLLECAPNPVANGSGSTTETAMVSGFIRNPDGSPAKGAKVRFISVDHNPSTGLSKRAAVIDSTTTNDSGRYTIDSMAGGDYNVLARGDSGLSYQDSVTILGDTTNQVPPDTLKTPGSLRGVVRLQPGHDPRKVFLIALGTNTFGSPGDSVGNFVLPNMAEGQYSVRILSVLDDYGVLDTSLAVRAGMADTLADTIVLPYTGIPIPSGLKIGYDTLKQIVSLTWNRPTTGRAVKGYNVYRKHSDSDFVKINTAIVVNTSFEDNTIRATATYQYKVAAIDIADVEGVKSDSATVNFNNRLVLAVSSTPLGKRSEHSSLFFDGKIWVIGGSVGGNLKGDVWYSMDGISWTQTTDSAAFGPRRLHSSVVLDNKMWVFGGRGASRSFNDAWFSVDGFSWTQATDSAAFTPRMNHATTSFGNKMWVIGGYGENMLNDVWYSSDGIMWTEATDSAQFGPRIGHSVIDFKGMLWLVGGENNDGHLNDVWYSQDGSTWLEATSSAAFAGRSSFSVAVLDSTLWLIGGYGRPNGSLGPYADIWSTKNGIDWQIFNIPPDFGPKSHHTAVVGDGRIWIVGATSTGSDVWYLR